ncbi:MAG: M20/M25/M40 family metallo-hydrolase [Rhodobacter sp.]|nr:M20/M25/M40 family metallo-hydrolase [Rhodobacter sp.]MCY4243039.1 M20/M25/M40 family metallo-hydrolase [Rhodobacter sp.]
MNASRLDAALARAQDAKADIELLRDALAIESVTGNETPFARFLESRMGDLDFETGRGEFLEGRENVWGVSASEGAGANLMIVGHSDVVHTRGWKEHWRDDPRSDPFAGTERDGRIWGRGASDLKGGICAAVAGLRLLRKAGCHPAGSVTLAFVGDEESGEPGTGVSAGARDLVRRVRSGEIAKPDFAIYVEPTKLDVYVAQIGFFIAEITVTGKTAYFGTPELGVDALKATHGILSRIWAHGATLADGPSHELVGKSSILVTGITGGGFVAVPGQCRLSLIRALRPGENMDEAVADFEAAVATAEQAEGISVSIDYPAGRDHDMGGSPVEIARDTPACSLLQACIRRMRPDAGRIGGASYWSEMPFLVNGIGCPAVYCAPGDIAVAHTFEERIEIEEYLAAVRVFALFVAMFCGLSERSPLT